jgi:hypothetical protein
MATCGLQALHMQHAVSKVKLCWGGPVQHCCSQLVSDVMLLNRLCGAACCTAVDGYHHTACRLLLLALLRTWCQLVVQGSLGPASWLWWYMSLVCVWSLQAALSWAATMTMGAGQHCLQRSAPVLCSSQHSSVFCHCIGVHARLKKWNEVCWV